VVQPDVGFALEGQMVPGSPCRHDAPERPRGPDAHLRSTHQRRRRVPRLHRCNVKDSILSYVGQNDPYSNDEWGRVTRNGIEAARPGRSGGQWWVSGAAGYDYYMGDSVWDNQAVHLDAAVGQTLLFDRGRVQLRPVLHRAALSPQQRFLHLRPRRLLQPGADDHDRPLRALPHRRLPRLLVRRPGLRPAGCTSASTAAPSTPSSTATRPASHPKPSPTPTGEYDSDTDNRSAST